MSDISEDQIESWLKKLERESWQLELLVSAFTIFLLIGANSEYDVFVTDLIYQYNFNNSALSVVYIFLVLIQRSIMALTISLIIHLMLRGFWIGTIGLRSVQSSIDFEKLNYTSFFSEKLKKKVVSLDKLVIQLDEICSVIFAFSFLVISILIAFGMYLIVLAVTGVGLSSLINSLSGGLSMVVLIFSVITFLTLIITGLIYMIDYFTLGFFKKIKWFSKVYYPFYRFYNVITLSGLSRSIYYYLISKFSKKRIRIVYSIVGSMVLVTILFSFDQYQFFPEGEGNEYFAPTNAYDDQRPDDENIKTISIPSSFVDKPHFQVFIRYNPEDNELLRNNCPDFEPIKDDGLNWKLRIKSSGSNFVITGMDFSKEDFQKLLECQKSMYQISVNDSVYASPSFHFYIHPDKKQKGILATIPTDGFVVGENRLDVKKVRVDSLGVSKPSPFVSIPFWYNPN
ncbi:hypothetical protein [Ekhidna sp.]|uniref:hypothetical protein n=1 Tax=Ekhidna sp. TaxID=2608089 RepID=UPI003CCC19F0